MYQAELDELRQRAELLKAEAKRAARAARLMGQLAAQQLEQLDHLQSEEDTRHD